MSQSLQTLKNMVCEGIDQVVAKGELNANTLDTVDKLTHTLKSIENIMQMENGGYSNGMMPSDGYYRYGNSYTGGSISNNGGGSYDSWYSRDNGKSPLTDKLKKMLDEAGSERERMAIRDCIMKMNG